MLLGFILAFQVNLFAQVFKPCNDAFDAEKYLSNEQTEFTPDGCNQSITMENIGLVKHGYWIYHSHFKTPPEEVYLGQYVHGELSGIWKRFRVEGKDTILVDLNTYKDGYLDGLSIKFGEKNAVAIVTFEKNKLKNSIYPENLKNEEELNKQFFLFTEDLKYINRIMWQNKTPLKE